MTEIEELWRAIIIMGVFQIIAVVLSILSLVRS